MYRNGLLSDHLKDFIQLIQIYDCQFRPADFFLKKMTVKMKKVPIKVYFLLGLKNVFTLFN